MATAKHRINISLSESMDAVLFKLAKADSVPVATKASELLKLAIDMEEDRYWDTLADKRNTKTAKYISHKKAWL